MATKLNSEFNYRYQVIGETIWEKIKTLKGFLNGRKRAAVLEEVQRLKTSAKKARLERLEGEGRLEDILELKAELLEVQSFEEDQKEAWELNRQEIETLERLIAEAFLVAEHTRISGYTDEQMFEANAANEFTVMIAKEIYSEIIANGRPSPAKIRNAMSNPVTWNACIKAGLIQKDRTRMICSDDPTKIQIALTNGAQE